MSRRWRIVVAIVAVLAGGSGRAEVVDRIIATVDGDPITAHELTQFREENRRNPQPSNTQFGWLWVGEDAPPAGPVGDAG